MLYLLIITFLCFSAYNIEVLSKFGIPESVSATSYLFNEKNGKHWWFTIICFIVSFGLFGPWIEISKESYQFLVFLTCGGIIFAGCSPFFRESFHKTIHYTSGILAFICCVAWLLLSGYGTLLGVMAILCLLILISIGFKYYVYVVEIIGFYGIWLLCIFNYV